MKQVLTHGSKWPLQPLDEDDRKKDVEEALLFGIHKGAVKQQDLLVTDNVIRGFALPLPLDKIAQTDLGSSSRSPQHPSAEYHQRTRQNNSQEPINTQPKLEVAVRYFS